MCAHVKYSLDQNEREKINAYIFIYLSDYISSLSRDRATSKSIVMLFEFITRNVVSLGGLCCSLSF